MDYNKQTIDHITAAKKAPYICQQIENLFSIQSWPTKFPRLFHTINTMSDALNGSKNDLTLNNHPIYLNKLTSINRCDTLLLNYYIVLNKYYMYLIVFVMQDMHVQDFSVMTAQRLPLMIQSQQIQTWR